ncbi:MAG TPA: histidine kinase, partial [Dermatophilaceae bacterium]|nr:histidine kinase [Dermatophilaceae bacterium]
MQRRTTLSGQLLALQLLIMLGVLAGVTAVSIAQSGESTRRAESRSARAAAESIAGSPLVRATLPRATAGGEGFLSTAAETSRSLSGARSVLLIEVDGTVITSADPGQIGTRFTFADSLVPKGRSWTGLIDGPSGTMVSSQVPVFAPEEQRIVGVAVVEKTYPSVL